MGIKLKLFGSVLLFFGCTPKQDYINVQCPEFKPTPILCAPCEQKICPDCSTYLDLYTKGALRIEDCELDRDGLKEEVRRAKENEEFWKRRFDEFSCSE